MKIYWTIRKNKKGTYDIGQYADLREDGDKAGSGDFACFGIPTLLEAVEIVLADELSGPTEETAEEIAARIKKEMNETGEAEVVLPLTEAEEV